MPRAAGQAAPPNFGKLSPSPQAADLSGATQITGMGPIAGSKPTADMPFIMPFDQRPLIDIIDLPEHYEIFEQVSEGGMGVIFRGRQRELERAWLSKSCIRTYHKPTALASL
jgi:hypothetical protein